MLKFIFILFFSSLALAAPQSTRVQGIVIQADSMMRDSEKEIIELEGNVQVVFQTQHLKCYKARINLRSKTVDAYGDVLVTSTQANIGGDRVTMDFESGTGVIYNGYVQSGTVLFEGNIITKTSEIDYLADNAKYTACTTCPEAWSFSGNKIRAELGGYAYIKNSVMRFGGVPFFWLPYLIVPLKSDRQSGILTPGIEQQDPGGLVFSQGFFWAISRSQDATITIKNYELRGLKSLVEYNYILSEKNYGRLTTGFLRDKVFATESRLNSFRNTAQQDSVLNRWFFNYEHYYEMPEGFVHRVLLANASDLQYPKDFDTETIGKLDSALENRMSLTKNSLSQHFSIDTSYYINLLQSNPLANNDDTVHRIPEIRFSQALSKIGSSDYLYTFDINYVNFTRTSLAYDNLNSAYNVNGPPRQIDASGIDPSTGLPDPRCATVDWEKYANCHQNFDGKYDAGKDLIRTGQRLDIRPTIYRPFKLGPYLDLLPKLSYRDTQYSFGVGENANISRKYVRAEVSAKTTASRIYANQNGPTSEPIKHEIQPEITATTIPWIDQPNHPFFGNQLQGEVPVAGQQFVSDQDLNSPFGLQFDYNDRVFDRKLMTLGLTNKLTQKSLVNNKAEYLQFFSWKLAQSYDLFQAERNENNKQPYSDVSSDIRLNLRNFQFSQQTNYFPYQQVTNTVSTVRVDNEEKDTAYFRYTSQYTITAGQEADPNLKAENYTVIFRKYSRHADFIGTTVYDANPPPLAERRFKYWAYGVEFKIPGDCSSISYFEKIEDGQRSRNLYFSFVWDGQAKSNFINQLSTVQPFGI